MRTQPMSHISEPEKCSSDYREALRTQSRLGAGVECRSSFRASGIKNLSYRPLPIIDVPRRQAHDVLPEHNVRFWKPFEHPVINHRLSALRGLLAWLKDRHQCPSPSVAALRKKTCCADQAGKVQIVPARVGYGYGFTARVNPRKHLATQDAFAPNTALTSHRFANDEKRKEKTLIFRMHKRANSKDTLSVRCPTCEAPPGVRCKLMSGEPRKTPPQGTAHRSSGRRLEMASPNQIFRWP